MCLIIDANVASSLQPEPSDDAKPVIDSIVKRKLTLVIGGKNTSELSKNSSVGRWLRGLLRANVARRIPDSDIDREERILRAQGQYKSNDVHVLALARASGARLLFSHDKSLAQDFKNRECLEPSGAVYKKRSHVRLLQSAVCRDPLQ